MRASEGSSDERKGEASEHKPRGFAAMSPEQHKATAAKGGREAHRRGVAHRFTKAEAAAAGRKGGAKMASVPGHMAELGRIGGRARKTAQPEESEA